MNARVNSFNPAAKARIMFKRLGALEWRFCFSGLFWRSENLVKVQEEGFA